MLDSINLKQVLFIDIETVPQFVNFEAVPESMKKHWKKKSLFFRADEETAEDTYNRAGIYAEFGKIVCITVGAVTGESDNFGFKIKSYFGDDEKKLLTEFSEMIVGLEEKSQIYLCAHNGKEFDYPYISRRLLINGLKLPQVFDNAGKKPWEVRHLDTLELWKFGDYKHYTSLDLLTVIFNIPSPKDEFDGSQVSEIYYEEKNLEKIVQYCERDVLAIAQLMMRYTNSPLIDSSKVVSATFSGS